MTTSILRKLILLICIMSPASTLGAGDHPYNRAATALSHKQFHRFPNLHAQHEKAYVPLLSDSRLFPDEQERLWYYYVLRLMTQRAFIHYKGGESYYHLKTVPELYEKRWHPVRHMFKSTWYKEALSVTCALQFVGVLINYLRRGEDAKTTMVNVAFNTVLMATIVTAMAAFMAVVSKEYSYDRIEKVYLLLDRMRRCEAYWRHMPPTLLSRLDKLCEEYSLAADSTAEKVQHRRHRIVRDFYNDIDCSVPAELKQMTGSCHGDLVIEQKL